MTTYVLDASVAAKWVLPNEPLTVNADALLRGYTEGRVSLVVPDLFLPNSGMSCGRRNSTAGAVRV